MLRRCLSPVFAVLAVAAVFALVVADADARPRMNAGSRGTRTYSAPPPTATAPNAAQPIQRSMTQPGQPGGSTVGRAATPASQPGGLFNRPGLLGGLAAGFLGAGLIGMLMGHGFMGGLGGLASLFGLLLQIGLVVIVGYLLWTWWQRRNQPAYAGGPDPHRMPPSERPSPLNMGALSGLGALGGSAPSPANGSVEIKAEDYNTFERLLGEIQTAYGQEDLNALRSRVTPEMLSYYSEEMAHNQSQGDINPITDIKLLQGDLAEAWREGNDEYATVAMRYSLDDRIVDRNNGKLIEQLPSEVTEHWTFRRAQGGNWVLSAIQQSED